MLDRMTEIQACALRPDRWPDALGAVLDDLGGSGGMLWSHPVAPGDFGLWAPCRLPAEALADYARHFHQHDVWMQAGLAKGLRAGEVVTGDDLLPHKDFIRSTFYRDFLRRFDCAHLLVAVLHRHDGSADSLPTVCLALMRGHAGKPFGAGERKKLQALVPHLQHATAVNFHLVKRDRRLSVAQAAVDLFCDALFFADRSGHIVHANRAAHALLAERDGLRLIHGRLIADDPDENRSLRDLFAMRESGVGSRESGVGSRRARCASPARAASRLMWPRT